MGIPNTTNTVTGSTNGDTGANGVGTLRGTPASDLILGLAGDDFLRGEGADDVLRGGLGSDVLDGGTGGGDVADFSDVTNANGGLTVDFSNPGSSGFAAAFVDRDGDGQTDEIDRINVNTVENVIGTGGDDDIDIASGTVFGSRGNDAITGDNNGFTVDYSHLGTGITLLTAGAVEKGAFGLDTLGSFGDGTLVTPQAIIANAAFTNTIDGTSRTGAVNITVNLQNNTFVSEVIATNPFNIPIGATFEIDVFNFDDIVGTDNNDNLIGDAQANVIQGKNGRDSIQGRAGDDTLSGGGGADTINGDGGNDRIGGGNNGDTLNGNANDDTIFGQNGNDTINGGNGFDTLIGGRGNDTFIGDRAFGDDLIFGDNDQSPFTLPGEFVDTVDYSDLGQTVTLLGSGEIKKGNGGTDTISGIEQIVGSTLAGDLINGENSTDSHFRINLGANLPGEIGEALLEVTLKGGPVLRFGIDNFENVIGTGNSDLIIGNNGVNVLNGLNGADRIEGRGGNDTIKGGGNNDELFGGGGQDNLNGGANRDMLNGGTGNDTLKGGGSKDEFLFFSGTGTDTVLDFVQGQDTFVIDTKNGAPSFDDIEAVGTNGFRFEGVDSLTVISNIAVDNLTEADFDFRDFRADDMGIA